MMKRFLLIDDHQVVRSGIKGLLVELFESPEVHEANTVESSVEKLRQYEFDLVLMDVQIPGSDMLELMKSIHTDYPGIKVLIFSMSSENIYAKRFLNAGAKGFLSKDSTFDETKKAISLILDNKRYISDSLAHALVEDTSRKMTDNPFNKLSKREFEITNLMLAGHTLTNICKSLGLSLSSVGTFKSRIFKKLETKNLIELSELARLYNLNNKA